MKREKSDLDRSANLDADDVIKAFDFNVRLAMAFKFIVRYSKHSAKKAGKDNLKRAINELESELLFNRGCGS